MHKAFVPGSEGRRPRIRDYRLVFAILLWLGLAWALGAFVVSGNAQAQTATKAQGPVPVVVSSFNAGSDQNNKPGVPPLPSATSTGCSIQYTDVLPGSTFYAYVRCLACRGIVGGYNTSPPCTTGTPCFLPGAAVTRGQMAKFVSNGAGFSDPIPPAQQTFTDVPPSHPLWIYIERIYIHGITAGYNSSPPCTTGTPCYLPGGRILRGQAAKFVSNGAGYTDPIPPAQQTFTDVPTTNAFWIYVERVKLHGVITGYNASPPCTTGTPCFLPANRVSRGQAAKFISNALIRDCSTP
jgi:hypothetical protein